MRYFRPLILGLLSLFFIEIKADMGSYYAQASTFAQKVGSTDANSFVKANEETLRKEQGYQRENVPGYASEVSLNSAAKTYEQAERDKGKDPENHKVFGFYAIAHDSGLKTDLEFDKEGTLQEDFMKDKAGEVYKDPLKMVQGNKTEIKRRKREKYTHTCVTPKSFELKVRRRFHYKPPPREFQNTELTLYYPGYLRKVGRKNDELAPLRVSTTNYQVNIERFRKYACPHFEPVDAVTGKRSNICCKRIKNFQLVRVVDFNRETIPGGHHPVKLIRINYQHDTYQTDKSDYEGWKTVNPETEEFTKKMNCSVKSRRCLDQVPRQFDELTVKRDCWEDEVIYECDGDHDNSCHEEDIKNCTLSKSAPFTYEIPQVGAPPITVTTGYERTYECTKETEDTDLEIKGGVPFCFDGSCHEPQARRDQDFAEVISKLNILRKMEEKQTKEPIHVFTGEPPSGRMCKVNIADFKDCCQSKGWGKGLGLADCDEDEKNLAKLKQSGQCHYLGHFCAEKTIFGICLAEKHSYCCYSSRLEREIQVQGSPQVDKGFGSPKHPNCRGFAIEELSKLDFDKINLAPLFEELARSKVRGKDMTEALSKSYKSHFSMSKGDMKNKFQTRAENKGGDL